jgi:hypothetical protein
MTWKTWLLWLSVLLLGGCAEANSIHRLDRLSTASPVVISSDAKQRFLLSQIDKNTRTDTPAFRRFCAEPSPDVFTVLSQSASGSGSLGLGKDAKTLNAAIQAAFSNSETGTTIPRTQTLNMLREMMFRTCERYLSGAITELELPIVAIRDQRVMVSILAIEQLTGAVTPKPVIISNGASASTGQNSTEMMKLVAKAHDDLAAAEGAAKDAEDAFQAADMAAGAGGCDQLEKDKKDGKTVSATLLGACTKTRDEREAANDAAKKAHDYYAQQAKTAAASQGVSSATATPGAATDPKDWSFAQATAVQNVAVAVKDIVALNFAQDETQFFCFKQISDAKVRADVKEAVGIEAQGEVQRQCLGYLMARVRADARKLGMTDQEFETALPLGTAMRDTQTEVTTDAGTCALDKVKRAKLDAALKADATLSPYYTELSAGLVAAPKNQGRLTDAINNLGYNNALTRAFKKHVEEACQ